MFNALQVGGRVLDAMLGENLLVPFVVCLEDKGRMVD